jgi:hypothetical protein
MNDERVELFAMLIGVFCACAFFLLLQFVVVCCWLLVDQPCCVLMIKNNNILFMLVVQNLTYFTYMTYKIHKKYNNKTNSRLHYQTSHANCRDLSNNKQMPSFLP